MTAVAVASTPAAATSPSLAATSATTPWRWRRAPATTGAAASTPTAARLRSTPAPWSTTPFTSHSSSGGDDGGGGIYSGGGGVSLGQATIDDNSFTLDSSTGGDNGGGGVYEGGGGVAVVFSTVDGNSLTIGTTGERHRRRRRRRWTCRARVAPSASTCRASRTTPSTSPTAGGDDGGGAILDEGGDGNVYLTSTISGNSVDRLAGQHRQWRRRHLQLRQLAISNLTIAGNSIQHFRRRDPEPGHNRVHGHDRRWQYRDAHWQLRRQRHAAVRRASTWRSANTCGFNAGGDLVNTDPHLGPLQNNGGPTLDAGAAGRESGRRRRLVHRYRTTAADDRPARRRAAAAGGWEVRHRRVRVDPRGTTAAASTTVKARDGSGQAGRDQHHRGELLEHGQPRGPDDDGRLPIRDRCALPPRRRLGHRL